MEDKIFCDCCGEDIRIGDEYFDLPKGAYCSYPYWCRRCGIQTGIDEDTIKTHE